MMVSPRAFIDCSIEAGRPRKNIFLTKGQSYLKVLRLMRTGVLPLKRMYIPMTVAMPWVRIVAMAAPVTPYPANEP